MKRVRKKVAREWRHIWNTVSTYYNNSQWTKTQLSSFMTPPFLIHFNSLSQSPIFFSLSFSLLSHSTLTKLWLWWGIGWRVMLPPSIFINRIFVISVSSEFLSLSLITSWRCEKGWWGWEMRMKRMMRMGDEDEKDDGKNISSHFTWISDESIRNFWIDSKWNNNSTWHNHQYKQKELSSSNNFLPFFQSSSSLSLSRSYFKNPKDRERKNWGKWKWTETWHQLVWDRKKINWPVNGSKRTITDSQLEEKPRKWVFICDQDLFVDREK